MAKKTRNKKASATKKLSTPPAGSSADDPMKTAEHLKRVAVSLTDGRMLNALTAVLWSSPKDGRDRTDAIRAAEKALESAGARVKGGDLGVAESLLMAQAVALNAMFARFAETAYHTHLVDHLERFTRLALRAQSQCAASQY